MGAWSVNRKKLAELTGGVGAAILGAGIGVILSTWLDPIKVGLVVIGLLLHAWGMYDKHQMEKEQSAATPRWSTALYWICWLLLAALIPLLFLRS